MNVPELLRAWFPNGPAPTLTDLENARRCQLLMQLQDGIPAHAVTTPAAAGLPVPPGWTYPGPIPGLFPELDDVDVEE